MLAHIGIMTKTISNFIIRRTMFSTNWIYATNREILWTNDYLRYYDKQSYSAFSHFSLVSFRHNVVVRKKKHVCRNIQKYDDLGSRLYHQINMILPFY
jgi:hypothetical protein